jgi:hypothetical protein
MASREKDQADFDLETFVDLFDTAMSSDNPTVQRALKNLVLISAMVNAQQDPDGIRKGPLRRVVDDIRNLSRRLEQLEGAGAYRSTYAPTTITSTGTSASTWTGTAPPAPSVFGRLQHGTIPPGTIISGTSAADTYNAQAINQIDVRVGSLLEKLEVK